MDCFFVDDAVTGSKNTNWFVRTNNGSVTVDNDGTTIDGTNGNHIIYCYPSTVTSPSLTTVQVFDTAFKGEFDIISVTGIVHITQYNGNDNNRNLIDSIGASNGDHISFWNNLDGNLYFQVNDETPTVWDRSSQDWSKCAVGFRASTGGILKFKNYKVYLI